MNDKGEIMATVAHQLTHHGLHAPPVTPHPSAMIRDTPFARETYMILHNTLFTILRERGRGMNGHGMLESDADPSTIAAAETLVRMCNEFIRVHGREADRNISTLDLSTSLLYQTYHQTAEAMFETEVSWGRIVALVSFTIAVAEKVYDMQTENRLRLRLVEDIETWLNAFFYSRLQDWIVTVGGWGGLTKKFKEKVNSKDTSTSGQWLTLTALGVAGVVATALLTR